MKRILQCFAAAAVILLLGGCASEPQNLRLLYWNIQNGMWDGQGDNYDRFVDFVKAQDPDICVWCEAQTIYLTDSDEAMPQQMRCLPGDWGKLAARYGHEYWGIGGYRDNYPQVITSKYPISYVSKITGVPDSLIVAHGAGWATVEIGGQTINLVTLHAWPMPYEFKAEDLEASKAHNGGDIYRAKEIQYVCEQTIGISPSAADENWIMMGDFNSPSIVDNDYYNFPEDTAKFLVHNYIRENTPYIDVIREKYGRFVPTIGRKHRRIDYVYCTKPMFDKVTDAQVLWNDFTAPARDMKELSNFYHPSDHLPILVDFDLEQRKK